MKYVVLISLVVIISIQVLQQQLGCAVAAGVIQQVPAVYVFGDSTLDVGNNNYLKGKDVPRANMPYYGIDLPGGHKPTGRFSNGYNVADFVAKNLGFMKSPPAYLSLKSRTFLIANALIGGVSYASAGAGILDSTNAGGNIPLLKQVVYFMSTRKAMVSMVGNDAVNRLFARSFFLLGVGSNDLFAFATAQKAQNKSATQSDVAALFTTLTSNYSAAITDLYKMGARKFGIINLGSVGCMPRVRVQNATGACNDGLNQLAVGFDRALDALLRGLAPKLPGLAYSLADSFGLSAAGFATTDSACCGSGRLGGEGDCLPNATLCADRDSYVFWDRVHPTQRVAMLSAQAFFNGPAQLTTPINFKQLARCK